MIELLKELLATPGVSGDEKSAADAVSRILTPLGTITRTPLGSVLCHMPAKRRGLPRIMLTAHLDQVGLMGERVGGEGFIKAAPCGGIDRRCLAGARVLVHTRTRPLYGVVCASPPHLSNGKTTPVKADEIWIDAGLSRADAEALFTPGDRITFDSTLVHLLNDRVCGAGLDNRAGCCAVIAAAHLLNGFEDAEIVVALTTREETGSAGALTAAFLSEPDAAFAVDVSMGLTPDDRIERCGVMGDGPMVGVSPILSRELHALLVRTAKQNNIPFQTEVMAGRTGTDADVIASSRAGVPTALLSIPLRYMHTPAETASLGDIEKTAQLLDLAVRGFVCV